ncbi:unnamed protein product [Cylicocyclus nassatus]|uniref:CMP/dCMP-type deaminase domain-containing protein n=1 Tax=Cylicocyclus nassatus TaxID=53992 RepID=A0AA36GYD0_CYLNA|nr:unnamed protein product [Cylicocyclus nassatus]
MFGILSPTSQQVMKTHVTICPEDDAPPSKVLRTDESPSRRISSLLSEATTSETLPLIDFYVVFMKNKQKMSAFLKQIPTTVGAEHLKRVDKSGRVLLQRVGILSIELLQALEEFGMTENDLQIAKVPSTRPVTRQQFDWAKQYWPTCFHRDKVLEGLLDSSVFTKKDKFEIYSWCKRALHVGSVVVQNGKELACSQITSQLLGHPVMTMVQELAKCPRQLGDYLATDCDVYLRDEPCAMCAMALVHCRSARVFFCKSSVNGVYSQGKWQLHLEPAINHHYRVFQVELVSDERKSSFCGR